MNNDNEKKREKELNPLNNETLLRKKYHKPGLEQLGDLRSLTFLGSTLNPSDTGGTGNRSWEGMTGIKRVGP